MQEQIFCLKSLYCTVSGYEYNCKSVSRMLYSLAFGTCAFASIGSILVAESMSALVVIRSDERISCRLTFHDITLNLQLS